ncbi:MAG: molybdenum cofactor guanylyltransferase [Myxococcales bacterium]|nr:molybdenum cofactor guanylyltransferase [Myxococcales bacterium]MDH3484159.1 molybdenum cofactor guanylyltransferase [Myxococcales bacterium]
MTIASHTQLAIFVGGESRRMGEAKGLLTVPGGSQTILEQLVDRGRDAGLVPLLVGNASPYSGLVTELPRVDDEPPGSGPLGGLRAALAFAREAGQRYVIAVACDMPHVMTEALLLLRDHPTEAVVLAPRRGPEAPWEPMLARYDAERLVPVLDDVIGDGRRSFQELFSEVEVWPIELTPAIVRSLDDWDTPEDVVR